MKLLRHSRYVCLRDSLFCSESAVINAIASGGRRVRARGLQASAAKSRVLGTGRVAVVVWLRRIGLVSDEWQMADGRWQRFMGSCLDPLARSNKDGNHAQILQQRIHGVCVEAELRPLQDRFVFLQDDRGETKRDTLSKSKGNKRGRNTSRL